jgi:two-component system, sporulation sensor kinase E
MQIESSQKNKVIISISLLSIFTGGLVISGWILHVDALQAIVPGIIRMKFNPAICLFALGSILFITQLKPDKYTSAISIFLISLVTVTGLLTFLEYWFHFDCGIDQLFFTDDKDIAGHWPYPGRMAVNSSFCFFLMGVSLFSLTSKKKQFHLISQYLVHLVTIIAAIALIGYMYSVAEFYKLLFITSMALHTAINLFILSIAASLLHPELGITSLFTGKRIGNLMAKRLFTLMGIMVIAFGSFRVKTQYVNLFSKAIGTSLLVICFLLAFLLTIALTAKWLNKIDEQRSKAEEEVQRINILLGKRVEERSSALINSLDKLQKSEEKYRSFIEQASDAIYTLDTEGNFTEVNDSMVNMVGFSREELLKMNIASLIDPEQLKVDPLNYTKLLPAMSKIRERKFVIKNGAIMETELNIKKLPDGRMLTIARDITQRKIMEAELKKAEIQFRTLADRSMVGIYIIQKGKFIYVNPRYAEIFGYGSDELKAYLLLDVSPIEILIREDYRAVTYENIRARLDGEIESMCYEVAGKKKDGTTNWIEFYGSTVMMEGEPTIIGSMIDVTERKRAENLMMKEKELSDTIINSLPGLFYLRNDKGEFLRWNKNVEIFSGFSHDEMKNSSALDFIAEESKETVAKAINKIFADGHASVEVDCITAGNIKVPYLLTGSFINYEDQPCFLGIGIDIAQRVKAIGELQLSEQKYKLLFEDNPLPMWMIAKSDLSIIAVNDSAAKLYGYTKEELLKLFITDLRLQEDVPQIKENYKVHLDDSQEMGVTKHIKKDGTHIDVQVIAHDIIFEGREVRLVHTNDITEKLKVQAAHQKSEANLQTILNNTDTAYVLLDNKLQLVEYNSKAVFFAKNEFNFDLESKDMVFDDVSYKKLLQFSDNTKAVLKGQTISYEINYLQPDDTNLWYYLRMLPIWNKEKEILGLMVAATDITERKNTEQSLRMAYEHIQTHIDSIKEITWKQSHLIRSPLANLKGLMPLMQSEPDNQEILSYIQTELDRMDSVIIEMAKDI